MSKHNLDRINALLRREGVVCAGRLAWFEKIGSTNSWMMAQHDIHGRVCLAELQTAGRGRRGRSWQAPASSSILLSIGWNLGDADPAGLSLVSGLAIIDSLRRAGVESVGLKWPNDLIVQGEKLGGVLTELSGANCVVGIGINVNIPPPAHDRISQAWVDLKSLGHHINRDLLASYLIVSHCRYLQRFCRSGFAQFVDEWNGLNVHQDQQVVVELPGESFVGVVQGINRQGALLLDQDGIQRQVISGSLSKKY